MRPVTELKDVRAVSIVAYTWFDKTNGTSYFLSVVRVNPGLENERVLRTKYQSGYGDHPCYVGTQLFLEKFDPAALEDRHFYVMGYYRAHGICFSSSSTEHKKRYLKDMDTWAKDSLTEYDEAGQASLQM